jgi:hypothetical protein
MTRSRSGTARTKSSGGLPRSGTYGDNWGCSASGPRDGHSAVTNSHPHRDAIDESSVFQPRPAIIDRRELEFSRVGVLRAISSSLRAASAFGLPPVPPTDVRLLPQEAKACFKYGSGQTAKSVYLDAEPLGALLVSFCIRLRIPMPKTADKGVHIEENFVVLGFRVERDDCVPSLVESERIQHTAVRAWSWVAP